jgi:predicted  nucleic acid-binding Zn-ribbon protein
MPTNEPRPRGRKCWKCGAQWVMSRDVHRVNCANCGERLTPYCPNNDYHEVRPILAQAGKPLRFNCFNGCTLGRKGFTREESEQMRGGRKNLGRFLMTGHI